MAKRLSFMGFTGIRRRTFLKGSLAGGALLGLGGGLLQGCGRSGGGGDQPLETVRRDLHFDLSHVEGVQHYELLLHVAGKVYALQTHTTDTRALCRGLSATYAQLPDLQLTHQALNVELPKYALQFAHVTGNDSRSGERDILCAVALHRPHARLITSSKSLPLKDVVRQAYGIESTDDDQALDLDSFVTPYDAARTFLFHHPDLMNLDPDVADVVLEILDRHLGSETDKPCSVNPCPLVCAIAQQGPAAAASGWMRKVDLESVEGDPIYLTEDTGGATKMVTVAEDGRLLLVFEMADDGTPLELTDEQDPAARRRAFKYEPTQRTLDAARSTLRDVLNEAMNDPRLQGVKWQIDQSGALDVEGDSAAYSDPQALAAAPGDAVQTKIRLDRGGGRGMEIKLYDESYKDVPGRDYKIVRLGIMNKFMRYLGVYVQWLDALDQPLDPTSYIHEPLSLNRTVLSSWHDLFDTDQSFFVGMVSANADLLSVPLPFVWTELDLPYLPQASACRIVVGSLGTGKKGAEVIGPSIVTGLVSLGLPAYFLGAAVALNPTSKKILKEAADDPETYKGLMLLGSLAVAHGVLEDQAVQDGNSTPAAAWAKLAGGIMVGQGLTKLRVAIVKAASASAATEAIPFIGWALWAVDIAASVSALAQTISEVASTPARYENVIRFTWSPTITVTPDPRNMAGLLPEEATRYLCTVKLKQQTFKTVQGQLPPGKLTQLAIQIKDLPLGGEASYSIQLLDAEGGQLGLITDRALTNTPDPAHYPASYALPIKEIPAHLRATTVYEHYDKIGFVEGQHAWLDAGQPGQPGATRTDLLCADNQKALCAPLALTISQTAHCAGYLWRGSGLPDAACEGGPASGGARYAVQNLSLRANVVEGGPEAFLVAPTCGYSLERPALRYDLEGPAGGDHFFVEPTSETTHHLRRVVLEQGQLTFGGGASWGLFSSPPDDLAVHAGGFVAAINQRACQLELLELPDAPLTDEQALAAQLIAGPGTRLGLLAAPVALAVSQDGTILVLEQGTARVSAFDTAGLLVQAFGLPGQEKRASFALQAESEAVTYLDLEVNGALSCSVDARGQVTPHGFLYVLSHVKEGREVADYRLDVYTADGTWLCRTVGLNAARIAVDHFRKLYTLNYETISGPTGMPEPSLSWWIPVG